jgi:hypothetical protein
LGNFGASPVGSGPLVSGLPFRRKQVLFHHQRLLRRNQPHNADQQPDRKAGEDST